MLPKAFAIGNQAGESYQWSIRIQGRVLARTVRAAVSMRVKIPLRSSLLRREPPGAFELSPSTDCQGTVWQSLVGLARLQEGNIRCAWSTKRARSPMTEKQNLINCSSGGQSPSRIGFWSDSKLAWARASSGRQSDASSSFHNLIWPGLWFCLSAQLREL